MKGNYRLLSLINLDTKIFKNNKPNKNDYISLPSWVYFRNARLIQHLKINVDTIQTARKKSHIISKKSYIN